MMRKSSRKTPYAKRKSNYVTRKHVEKPLTIESSGGMIKIPRALWTPGQTYHMIRTRETVFEVVYNGINSFTTAALSFKLSDFASSDVTALFDQYRFNAVEVKMIPRVTDRSPDTSIPPPYLFTAIDYDDAAAITAISDILQYANCQSHPWDKSFVRRFRPNVALAAYGGGVFSSYANKTLQWIDVASTGVEHYGFKVSTAAYSTSLNTAVRPVWDIVVKAYLEFKSVR